MNPEREDAVEPTSDLHVDLVWCYPTSANRGKLWRRVAPDDPTIGAQVRDGSSSTVDMSKPHTMAECPFPNPEREDAIEREDERKRAFSDLDALGKANRLREVAESQLAAVDRALPPWEGTGKGRVATILDLLAAQRRTEETENALKAMLARAGTERDAAKRLAERLEARWAAYGAGGVRREGELERAWEKAESERDALAGALREVVNVLGPEAVIDCEENGCEGCKAEMDMALNAARSALAANPQASDG